MSKARLVRKVSELIVPVEDIHYEGEQVYYNGDPVTYEHAPIGSLKYECPVEADPTSTNQNASPVKGGWKNNFLWTLYEKTLKAFFDALLGKYGPK